MKYSLYILAASAVWLNILYGKNPSYILMIEKFHNSRRLLRLKRRKDVLYSLISDAFQINSETNTPLYFQDDFVCRSEPYTPVFLCKKESDMLNVYFSKARRNYVNITNEKHECLGKGPFDFETNGYSLILTPCTDDETQRFLVMEAEPKEAKEKKQIDFEVSIYTQTY